ncbi:MAG: (Fe-S)-binding protein [Candidatus Eisenbacteria bacterium]|uniref:Glycolate oxidase iron-sulfur subunit n=1 Tax=Eiseniibacteriota bacterium TaxID=2212470 RepID=A0A948W397_UNCEI|nr:(Fe-S)-binding protein [Candidatus Eisenbacteria bacterium]MBU1947460.1 (Fe-S)-binding protein [Candidatus Eisenbacteria bacterium]MBU2690847.1 (Fe-S)-binding protein [Candidatus Eisenbacteria bacterium]
MNDRPVPSGDLYRDCIHCGLCLESCPTYKLRADETISPRGRLRLIEAHMDQHLRVDDDLSGPLESCLLCRSCEAMCPSGVPFGAMMEAARERMAREASPPFARAIWSRLLKWFFLYGVSHPPMLKRAARVLKIVQKMGILEFLKSSRLVAEELPWLLAAAKLAPPLSRAFEPCADSRRSCGDAPDEVLLFAGCVTPWALPDVSRSMDEIVKRLSLTPVYPDQQTCCGALHLHHGDIKKARELARRNIDAFDGPNGLTILVEAAGCGAALKSYGELLKDDPVYAERAARFSSRVKDLSEWLVSREPPSNTPCGIQVIFQDPCHLRHVQRGHEFPRRLLQEICGLDIVEVPEAEICCGSGGIANLLEYEIGEALGRRKAEILKSANPDFVVTSNPGCLLQLRRHLDSEGVQTRHLAEVLVDYWAGVKAP